MKIKIKELKPGDLIKSKYDNELIVIISHRNKYGRFTCYSFECDRTLQFTQLKSNFSDYWEIL